MDNSATSSYHDDGIVAVDEDSTAVASQAVVGHGAGLAESSSPTALMTTVTPYACCRFFDGEGVKRAGERGEVVSATALQACPTLQAQQSLPIHPVLYLDLPYIHILYF
jgi:hypothetical protein